MGDGDSLFDRARVAAAGPTPAERAAELNDRAADDPASLSAADANELIGLLDADDPDVVGDALGAMESLAVDRPEPPSRLSSWGCPNDRRRSGRRRPSATPRGRL